MRSISLLLLALSNAPLSADEPAVTFASDDFRVVIHVDGQPTSTYVFRDPKIPRPYFAHIKAPGGVQVTRNHPPIHGIDPDDHADMHPGIWLAFGDINGEDFWRNKGQVVHKAFLSPPTAKGDAGSFVERKVYLRADGTTVCEEEFRFAFRALADAHLYVFESVFQSNAAFSFGDQEEMGLGLRVATSISERSGGRLTDSAARAGAKAIWGQSASWCDYSGQIDGESLGLTLMCHPSNFRESWFHARDYGLLVANAFGRKAMHQGEPSKIAVQPGDQLRLRYLIYVHRANAGSPETIAQTYRTYAMGPKE